LSFSKLNKLSNSKQSFKFLKIFNFVKRFVNEIKME